MSKSLVNKATVDNRDPCQGFHLRELAEATKHSIDDTQTIEDQLVKQLKRNKPNVKRKALKCVKYICDNGSSNFKRGFQRHTHILRECAKYRGPPDPVYGDAPYEEVREAAKFAIDALFQTTNNEQEEELRSRIQGMGSSGMNAMGSGMGSNSDSYSVNKYTGHGGGTSSSTSSSKNDQGITGKVWGWMGGKKNEPKDNFSSARGYGGPSATSSSGGYQMNSSNPASLNGDTGDRNGKRSRGGVGGVWGTQQATVASIPSSTNFGSQPKPFGAPKAFGSPKAFGPTSNTTESSAVGGKIKSIASTGEYEQQIIDAATHSTGVKVAPTRKELSKFVQQYQSLDQDTVAELLAEKMESDVWQVQLKSLYLTEAVLKSGFGEDLLDFLQKNEDLIEELMKATKRNVRTKAKDVAQMLGMATGKGSAKVASVNVPAPQVQVQQQQQQDLLDFGTSDPAPAKQDDIFSAGPAASSGGDMFSGMNTSETDNTTDMFGSMSLGDNSVNMFASTTEKSDPAKSDDFFSGLTSGPAAATSTSVAPLSDPIFSATKKNPADDLLASLASSTSQPTNNAPSNFFMTSSQPVQNNTPAFNLNQPAQPTGGFMTQNQPNSFMSTSTQPSSGFDVGFGSAPQPTQNQGGFGFVNTQQTSGFGMQPNQGFPMQANPGFGMQPAPNPGFGMQQHGFNMMQNRGMQAASPASRPGMDHFANLMQTKQIPAASQQKHKRGGSDAFADLVKF